MSGIMWKWPTALAVLLVAIGSSTFPTKADDIVYTVNGLIKADSVFNGIDGGGYFGPAGASLVGDRFLVTWTASSDCECTGGEPGEPPNPILDVTLTINGHSFDFGGNSSYGEFYLGNNSALLNLQQTSYANGNLISTNLCCGFLASGAFEISNGADSTTELTTGVFTELEVGVPAPIAGAGLPGLIFASGGFLAWWRRKRKAASQHALFV